MNNLVQAYGAVRRFEEAIPLHEQTLKIYKTKFGPDHPATLLSMLNLADIYGKQLRYAEAESLLHECLTIRTKQQPDHWVRFDTMCLLGDALLEQGKYDAAKPFLLEGYEGMKQREANIPRARKIRLAEAIERIVRLYEATEQADKARIWREKLPASKRKAD